jgi:hypothetical protein
MAKLTEAEIIESAISGTEGIMRLPTLDAHECSKRTRVSTTHTTTSAGRNLCR